VLSSTVMRVAVLGRGGAGTSTFARWLTATGAEWIGIDKLFLQPGLVLWSANA